MLQSVCFAKIHRATVTGADLNYVGSVTIDQDLLDAAKLLPNTEVRINSLRNGTSWQTYIVSGARGSGDIILNGPPAHHFKRGDMVIILAYGLVTPKVAKKMLHPTIVFVDKKNRITEVKKGWRPV